MVRVVNHSTGWDQPKYAGTYVTLDIGDWTYKQWMLLMMRHISDYKAPVVLHPILRKRYYPYLDDDASGHFQVGRGYDKNGKKPALLGYFEPWNQQRFDPSEPLHRARAVAQRLQELPRQPGPLPAQRRRLMTRADPQPAVRRRRGAAAERSPPAVAATSPTPSPRRPTSTSPGGRDGVAPAPRAPRRRREPARRRHRRRTDGARRRATDAARLAAGRRLDRRRRHPQRRVVAHASPRTARRGSSDG